MHDHISWDSEQRKTDSSRTKSTARIATDAKKENVSRQISDAGLKDYIDKQD